MFTKYLQFVLMSVDNLADVNGWPLTTAADLS